MSTTSKHGESPFGMNRKYRRALFSSVKKGTANKTEVQRFQSLGKDAYPWMSFREVINGMKRKSLKEK